MSPEQVQDYARAKRESSLQDKQIGKFKEVRHTHVAMVLVCCMYCAVCGYCSTGSKHTHNVTLVFCVLYCWCCGVVHPTVLDCFVCFNVIVEFYYA